MSSSSDLVAHATSKRLVASSLAPCTLLTIVVAMACAPQRDAASATSAPRPAVSRESTVGMPARIEELVLPGPELVVAPGDAHGPIVLRITRTSPHGTAFRYDLEYSILEPGEYDLRQALQRADGSRADKEGGDVPPIPVTIRSVLAAGSMKPHAPAEGAVPPFGGYRTLLIAGAVVWTLGLFALLFARRKRRQALEASRAKPRTLAERLRPLVERAQAGTLSRSDRAALELALVAYWRKKLGLEERAPEEALEIMRTHADAGPLLRGLENWLHRPRSQRARARAASDAAAIDAPATDRAIDYDATEIAALLAPYRDLPADAFDATLELDRAATTARKTSVALSR